MDDRYDQNFAMKSGDSAVLELMVTGPDGQPLDLTGAALTWGLGTIGAPPLVTKTSGGGGGVLVEDPATGLALVSLAPADTAGLAGNYAHELQVVAADGAVSTPLAGTAHILADLIP